MSFQPVLHWIFGPHFFDVGAVLCIGLGFAMALSADPKDIPPSLWFLGVAALLAAGRAGHWLVTDDSPPLPKPIMAGLLFGAIGVMWITAHSWAQAKMPPVSVTDRTASVKRIRESLGRFMIEGQALMDKCLVGIDHEPPQAEADAWANSVYDYLKSTLDSSYSARFAAPPAPLPISHTGVPPSHDGLWGGIGVRIDVLRSFIQELGR